LIAFNWDMEEEVFFFARGFSTVFRRSGDGVEGWVQGCKIAIFSGVGSISGCSIVVNRAAGTVVWSLYVSAIGVDVGT
jgi:hypothetical protein